MADVHRARTVIEPPALAALALTVTDDQLAELSSRLEATNDAIGDPLRYSLAIENLRERIVEMTGAITLSLIMRLLREVVQKHTTAAGGVPPERWAKVQKLSQHSHQKLIQLIGAGDPVAAESFWRKHLAEVEHHLGRIASTRVIDLAE